MDRPLTEVQKFIKETQRQIDEEGLVGISGTHFDRGDKPFRVLKAKQYEYRLESGGMMGMLEKGKNRKGKFASIALIAKDLNAMNQSLKDGDFTTLTFDDSQALGDDVETYIPTDRIASKAMSKAIAKGRAKPLKFNDSTQKNVD